MVLYRHLHSQTRRLARIGTRHEHGQPGVPETEEQLVVGHQTLASIHDKKTTPG
jgi:hypothetical protein